MLDFDEKEFESIKMIYRKYLAIKQYFHGSFDYDKYKGLVSERLCNGLQYKPDYYRIRQILKKYNSIRDIEQVLVWNIYDKPKFWIGDIDYNRIKPYYSFRDSYLYQMRKELKPVFVDVKYNHRFNSDCIYREYIAGDISINSLLTLNISTKYLDKLSLTDTDFIFAEKYTALKKLEYFIRNWNEIDFRAVIKLLKEMAETAKDFNK